MERFPVRLAAIVGAGVALRAVYLFTVARHVSGVGDWWFYHWQANDLASGKFFIEPFRLRFTHQEFPSAGHPPLYPAWLSIESWLGGTSVLWHRALGLLTGATSIALMGVLGRRVGGEKLGLVAAGVCAVYPLMVVVDGALMSETLYGLLTAASLLAAYWLYDRPSLGRGAALGALVALTALTRGEALILLPLLLVPLLWRREVGSGELWRVAGVALVAFLLVLTPWTARNWIVFNRPVAIATNSGTAVAGANCAVTYASGDHLGGWYPPCIKEHPGKNEAEHHALALDDGVRYARDHAGRLPVVLAARLGRVWSVYKPFAVPEGRSVRVQKLGVIAFFVLLPFAVGGYVLLRRRGEVTWILLTPFIIVTVTALTTYGNLRFREPAEVALAALAAVAVDELIRRRRVA